MNRFAATLHEALAWGHAQVKTLGANFWDVVTNKPEPAMQVLICTVATIALAWGVLRLVKKASK